MDLEIILAGLITKMPWLSTLLMVLGCGVVLGTAYIKATPSKEDDAWFDKLEASPVVGWVLKTLKRFSLITRKDPPA